MYGRISMGAGSSAYTHGTSRGCDLCRRTASPRRPASYRRNAGLRPQRQSVGRSRLALDDRVDTISGYDVVSARVLAGQGTPQRAVQDVAYVNRIDVLLRDLHGQCRSCCDPFLKQRPKIGQRSRLGLFLQGHKFGHVEGHPFGALKALVDCDVQACAHQRHPLTSGPFVVGVVVLPFLAFPVPRQAT